MQHHHPQYEGPSEYDLHMDQHLLYPSTDTASSFPPFAPIDSTYSNSAQMDLRNLLLNPRNLLPSPKGYNSQESSASFPQPSFPVQTNSSAVIRPKIEPSTSQPPTHISSQYQYEEPYSYEPQVFDSVYAAAPSRISPVSRDLDVSHFPSPQQSSSTHFPSYYSFSPCESPQGGNMVPSPALTNDVHAPRIAPPVSSSYIPYPLYSYEPMLELPSSYFENPVADPPKPDPPFPLPWVEKKGNKSHSGPKPFVCRFPPCTAGFNRNHDLKRHERIHTGEKRWECDVCGRAFGRRDALSRHTSAPGGRCKAVFGKRVRKAGLKMEYLLNKAADELREIQ